MDIEKSENINRSLYIFIYVYIYKKINSAN